MKLKNLIIYILIGLLLINSVIISNAYFFTTTDNHITFSDVPDGYWAKDAIETLANQGIINGKTTILFKPNDPITRAEFTKLIIKLLDLHTDYAVSIPFGDVSTRDWYYVYILSAYSNQLVNGKSEAQFSPNSQITREEVFTVVFRLMTRFCLDSDNNQIVPSPYHDSNNYTDGDTIASYAIEAIDTLITYGQLTGYSDNSIRPKNLMTRAEAATIINRIATAFSLNPNPSDITPLEPVVSEYDSPVASKYKLSESTNNLILWTDYPSERIFRTDSAPESVNSGIHVYLAKNEFEPFQLILKPQESSNITIKLNYLPKNINVDLYKVMYVNLEESTDNLGQKGLYPDPLYPIEFNESIGLSGGENNPLWFSLHTNEDITAGDYSFEVSINDVTIPIYVHVFNFAIPKELHVKSQINVSTNSILEKYGVSGTKENYWKYVDNFKQFFIDHRLTPKSALWSGGLTNNGGSPYIDYNSTTGVLSDPYGIWGFEYPADRYLDGNKNTTNPYLPLTSFNGGVGFPSFMAMTFKNNDTSNDQRPDTFEGIKKSTSDWYASNNPDTPYNQKWFSYIRDIEHYLTEKDLIDKAYYYVANEPQNQEDYDAVSWYSQQLKKSAPNLKLMISEEPKPEIYNNSSYPGVKIDQWLAVLNNYDPIISWDRETNNNEETWIYFLHGTKPPYFNPITLDHPGIESKLTGWFLWKYRIKGIAHYSFNNWSQNVWETNMTSGQNGDDFMLYPPSLDNVPITYGATNHRFVTSIRFELMRDSLEDYEYLYMLNSSHQPMVNQSNQSDSEVDKIIYSLTSYNRDSHTMYALRFYIGMKIDGDIDSIPDIQPINSHERTTDDAVSYYINFQDPEGNPSAKPLIIDNKEYMKIGWSAYDEAFGYGWYGDMSHVMYQYVDNESDPLKSSIIYDDWGREKTFEFDLPNGTYDVTVCCGWHGRIYNRNMIRIEGISFIDDEATNPYLVRTHTIEIKDSKLTMEMGIFDEYTMLNYLEIVRK